MRTYQVVPYRMHVHPRDSTSDVRPLDDIDGRRTALIEVTSKILGAARGLTLRHRSDPNRLLEVTSVRVAGRAILAELSPGRRGIDSDIEIGPRRRRFHRGVEDTEWPAHRYLIYFPPRGHMAVMLAEKVGTSNGIGVVAPVIKDTFRRYHPGFTLSIESAMTEDLLREWARRNPINAMVFRRAIPGDRGRLIRVGSRPVHARIELRPGRRMHLPWTDVQGSTLGVLTDELGLPAGLLEGWETAVEVTTPTGSRRMVSLSGDGLASISFPVVVNGDGDPEEQAERPSRDQFVDACLRVMVDYAEHLGVPGTVSEDCRWGEEEWADDTPVADRWVVQWGERLARPAPP